MTNNNKALLIILVGFVASLSGLHAGEKPNVIVIMADDLGYRGSSSYDAKKFKTPEIDQLAAEGIKFTDFHSNGSVCSPTRAALMNWIGDRFSRPHHCGWV